jgi:hypothetical protein
MIPIIALLFISSVLGFSGPKDTDCDHDNYGPMYDVPIYDRLIVAATEITVSNNNPFAVVDPLHARFMGTGFYNQADADQLVAEGLDWFLQQFCFNFTGVTPSAIGSYTIPGMTAYPYAGLPTFQPTILIDNAYPRRQDGNYYWTDYGLLLLTSTNGTYGCGPLQGKTYPAGSVVWYTWWDVIRRNMTLPNGRLVPSCRGEQFVSRSVTPSLIDHNAEGNTEEFLRAQIVTRNGYVGLYNDVIGIVYGTEGLWEGIGGKWETSRLVLTWNQYHRPS